LEFVQRPDTRAQGSLLADMYQRFITDFEHRINPLQLVEICLPIVRTAQNPQEAIQFLQKLSEKVKNEQVPNILVRTALGALYLEQKKLDEARVIEKRKTH
jgi:26S proteasome regulatory subunit N9